MTTALEAETYADAMPEAMPATDAAGDIFDPEIHAAKPNGEPSVRTDGTFRKKRRDAGGRSARRTSTTTRSKSTAAPTGMPKAMQEQHAKHVKGIKDASALPMTALGFISPIDAYTLTDLVDPFANAVATVAQDTPQLAAVLDKLGGAGGWGTVVALVGLATLQVMHNHDRIPEHVARIAGVKPKSETIRILEQRGAALAAQAQQQQEYADAAAA